MTKRTVRLVAYDRPEYLREVVDSIKRQNLKGWTITGSIDQRSDGTHNPEVVKLISEITDDIRLRPRLDCGPHVKLNFSEALEEGFDYVLHAEDDVVYARGTFDWFRSFEGKMTHGVTGQSSRHREHRKTYQRETTAYKAFVSLGTYMTRKALADYLRVWHETDVTWDSMLHRMAVQHGFTMLIPTIARVKHIGRRGRYCTTDTQFLLHTRKKWIEDFEHG